jgi:hypothetical protein
MDVMTQNHIFMACVAGLNIEVKARHPEIKELFHYFLIEQKEADFSISVDDELFNLAAGLHRSMDPSASDQRIESLALQYALCHEALRYECMVIHGSALQLDGEAYVFSAPSKTGKSTHSRMWREVFGERVSMINDDMPLLRRQNGAWQVCGTPWNGKHGLGFNHTVPLKAICLLSRGENSIRRYQQEDIPYLLNQILRPFDPGLNQLTFDILNALLSEVPAYHMSCTPTHNAAVMAKNFMKEGLRNED